MRKITLKNSESACNRCEPADTRAAKTNESAFTVALVGNPNAGKTTLFNVLTGLHAKTANFPGTTIERKVGRAQVGCHQAVTILDLPGLYSLENGSPEERVASDALQGRMEGQAAPDAALIVVDATNLERNLFLTGQVLEMNLPTVIALNMMDAAESEGIRIDTVKLRAELGCAVVPISARTGRGIDDVRREIARLADGTPALVPALPKSRTCGSCHGCAFQARYEWTEAVSGKVTQESLARRSQRTEKLDETLTHPVLGAMIFAGVMLTLFALIFWVAKIPMNLIDELFTNVGALVAANVPAGDLQNLLVNGVIAGIGGVLIFLPQICILFLALSLIEDTGYLARAAFVMDKIMRRFGLPGKAFVPMLSAHACAIPAIMSARVIENPGDRLVTILITPLLTCPARIPVFAMVTALLFPNEPVKAALIFTGAYASGVVFAMLMAWVFRRTILPGGSKPLVIELPPYRLPSLRTALLHTYDRAKIFVKTAGTIILFISLVLWALSYYPKSSPPPAAVAMTQQVSQMEKAGDTQKAADLRTAANQLTQQNSLQNSFAGKIGRTIEPAIRPLGFDWQIGIGIVSSFAAREVIVSTLAVVYGVGDNDEQHRSSLYDTLRRAKRSDGTPIFTMATCASLLIFYILAAQCLSTTAVIRRETNSWKWPLFQVAYMSALAYAGSFIVYQAFIHFTR